MLRNFLFVFLCMTISLHAVAQDSVVNNDTVFNQTDKQGLKQGFWKVKYENGHIRYEGFFKDGKPSGILKRFYPDGTIQAKMEFSDNGKKAQTTLYYNNGVKAAEGFYVNEKKDSVWKYYSYYNKNLSAVDRFDNGKKNGVCEKYYSDGSLLEELMWKEGVKDGIWNQYFQNGRPKLTGAYKNDKRQGKFTFYYPDGSIETKGAFNKDMMDGSWITYNPNGKVEMTIIYKMGKPQNPEVLEEREKEFFDKIEKNKGKFPEPGEELYNSGGNMH